MVLFEEILLIIANAMADLSRTANHKFIHQNNKAKHLELCNSSFGAEAHLTQISPRSSPGNLCVSCVSDLYEIIWISASYMT
jgi:hypothetical protein